MRAALVGSLVWAVASIASAQETEPPPAEEPGAEEPAQEPGAEEAPAEETETEAEAATDTEAATETATETEAAAQAEEPRAQPGAPLREEGQPPSIPRRPMPDYDGRADPGMSVEEGLLWIPRVLFFPIHVIFEYVLRQPIGWFLTTAEREQWSVVLIDFFTWNERKSGLVPTAFFDFGFQPSVGLYFWWNELFAEENSFRAQIGFGGVDWLRATISDRVQTSRETELAVTVDAWRRPDNIFQGIGWSSTQDERSRFFLNYVEGRIDFRIRPWRASEIAISTGVRWNDFEQGGYQFQGDDPSLGEAVMQGWYPLPDGMDGYTSQNQRLQITIDTREDRPAPGHGVRIEAFADQGFDLTNIIERRWIRYGGAAGGFLDVGSNRVLALWGLAHFADPLGEAPVPCTELVSLGGDPLIMSGFLRGSLLGRSGVVATLEYRYPIWVFLDGSLHFSVGNVFDEHLSDFDVERLRMSFGLGIRSIGDRDQSFSLLVAFGSRPFIEGGDIDSVRLVIGSTQGF
jgi:hypothetical protein